MLSALFERLRHNIAASFIVIVLFILVAGQGSLWVWFLFTQKEQARATLLDKVDMAGTVVAEQTLNSLETKQPGYLKKILERIADDEDIISIRVRDVDNKTVAQTSTVFRSRTRSLNPFFIDWKGTLVKEVRSGRKDMGSIVITYSGERVNEFMTGLLTVAPLAQALVFVIIIYAIYFFFQRRVGSPISTLHEVIVKITGGDFNVEVPELRDNDLGDIASGLRFLVEGLSDSMTKLNTTADVVSNTIFSLKEMFQKPVILIKKQSNALDDIMKSLRKASESQEDISKHTDRVSTFSEENVAALLEVKATADEIVSSMETLFNAAESSYSVVSQLAQTSKVMNDNAGEILESVENTSASVEEILASVREVERNAKESSTLAENVRGLAAHKGVNVVAEAVSGMERITERVRVAVDIVNMLENKSMDIQTILSVIRDVTERTHLLSLNASILAEQAGEYGKGFAVVAEEMRALSSRTATYTKDISGIVNTIQAEISQAVQTIEESMDMVQRGGETVYRVGETMSDILESAHKSALMAKMIERATEDQSSALHHIEISVVDINRMALNMTNTMQEQQNASMYMLERVGEVREIAESTQKSTREQAEGTRAISRNFEHTNEQIAGIQEAGFSQQRVNYGILSAVEDIRNSGSRALEDIEGVASLLAKLRKEMDLLKKEMGSLRTR